MVSKFVDDLKRYLTTVKDDITSEEDLNKICYDLNTICKENNSEIVSKSEVVDVIKNLVYLISLLENDSISFQEKKNKLFELRKKVLN
jgi:tRNA G26 N,N-dimethylase Trm1